MRKTYESPSQKLRSCKEAIDSGWVSKDFRFSEQRGLGRVSAVPTEEANMKPDNHRGHIDTTTTAGEGSV